MPLYVVETIATFRHKYVIECKSLDHAYDTVAMNEAPEFSQMYLGEQIVTGRPVTKEEFDKMVKSLESTGDGTDFQPETGSHWMGDKLIHVVDYATLQQKSV